MGKEILGAVAVQYEGQLIICLFCFVTLVTLTCRMKSVFFDDMRLKKASSHLAQLLPVYPPSLLNNVCLNFLRYDIAP